MLRLFSRSSSVNSVLRRNHDPSASSLIALSSKSGHPSGNSIRELQQWIRERLFFNPPKGFQRYYPKNKDAPANKPNANKPEGEGSGSTAGETAAKPETGAGSSGNKKRKTGSPAEKSSESENPFDDLFPGLKIGGGSGGGAGKNPNMMRLIIGSTAAVAAALTFLVMDDEHGKEISWQDFQKILLESGQVDRIVVVNNKNARVVLRSHVDVKSVSDRARSADNALTALLSTDQMRARRVKEEASRPSSASSSDPFATEKNPFETIESTSGGQNNSDVEGDTWGDPVTSSSRYPRMNAPVGNNYAPYYFRIGSVETFEHKLEEAQRELGIPSRDFIPVMYTQQTSVVKAIMKEVPTLITLGLAIYLIRNISSMGGGAGGGGRGIFGFGKSPAKKINKELVNVTYKDVAGCDEAKREIMEFVEFLKNPKRFTDLGAKIPKGALLCGPPGTGKTLLAKATAGEANVPFFSVSGSDFVEMFVGVGASRVRELFKEARQNAPCIVFIDEIDAVGRKRGQGKGGGSNDEREATLNQLLVEMDGFNTNAASIVVLAGTNRADVLDSALTRPGRFDRQIQVEKPDIKGRRSIFEIYLKNVALDGPVENYSSRLAALTPGFSGADISNIVNEAAIVAARREKKAVDMKDFETATDRVIGGLESKKLISPEEKRVVAYHEAGHAVAGWFLEYADPLLKVTIVPRGNGSLGFAQYLPKEIFLRTKDQILDMVCMALAGRASEQVNFGRYTTGASDDLRRVTQIVYQMVQVYGMNEKVGQVGFQKEDNGFFSDKMYSEATAEVMDEEVRLIVAEAYKRTIALMEEKKEQVRLVAELLLEQETISHNDVAKIIGPRPFSAGKEYDEFVTNSREMDKENEMKKPTEGETEKVPDESSSNKDGGDGGVAVAL